MRWIFLLLFLFVAACSSPKMDTSLECSTDSDCAVAGCSGQLCLPKEKALDIVTTCEYLEEYTCYQQSPCGCSNGVCSWPEDVTLCLAEYR